MKAQNAKFMQIPQNILFNLFFASFKSVIIPKTIYIIPHKKYNVVKKAMPYSPPIPLFYSFV
jgi:cobalamin biosynthesis Co2+ chelatase CbiK